MVGKAPFRGRTTKDIEEKAKAVAAASSSSNRRVTLQPYSGVPYHERTEARMGGLGWNQMGDALSQRARQMLTQAGYVDHQQHVSSFFFDLQSFEDGSKREGE